MHFSIIEKNTFRIQTFSYLNVEVLDYSDMILTTFYNLIQYAEMKSFKIRKKGKFLNTHK